MADKTARELMQQRDRSICDYYLSGRTQKECSWRFKLCTQRIAQVLKSNGVQKPVLSTRKRSKFLGVNVTDETKLALTKRAKDLGVSVSKLVSDGLDETVK